MKKAWSFLGTTIFWLFYPVVWMILNNTKRSRLVMVDDNRLLVMKGLVGGKWTLPGGGLRKNESPEESLLREVKEELGFSLKARQIKFIANKVNKEYGIKTRLYYFLASKPKTLDIHIQKIEVLECRWVDYRNLNSRNSANDVLEALNFYPWIQV